MADTKEKLVSAAISLLEEGSEEEAGFTMRSRISSSFSTSSVCSMRSISDSGGSLFISTHPYSYCEVFSLGDTGMGFSVPVMKSYSASGSLRQYFMVQSASHISKSSAASYSHQSM